MKPRRLGTVALVVAAVATHSCRASDSGGGTLLTPGCQPPADSIQPPLGFGAPPTHLAGTYELTVVATYGARSADTVETGQLVLHPANPLHVQAPNPRITRPLEGWSDVPIGSLAEVSLAYSPASRDQSAPGVQLIFDGQRLKMIMGNAFTSQILPNGVRLDAFTTDSGVIFEVYRADSLMLLGRWRDGGFGGGSGYFCARRVNP